MERYGLRRTACKVTLGTPVLTPRAPDSLAEACQELYRLASAVTSGQDKVVLSFSFWGSTVRLHLTEAKAATVICAIGIGVGLGTYLLYRIYCRFIQPSPPKDKARKRQRKPHPRDGTLQEADEESLEESTDDEMGNSGSSNSLPVRYSPVSGVHIGRRGRPDHPLHNNTGSISKPRHRKQLRGKARLLSNSFDTIESPSDLNGISSTNKGGIDIQNVTDDRLIQSASDLTDTSSICGSLKGNLSLKSLYDRNHKYGYEENCQRLSQSLIPRSSEESLRIEVSSGQEVPSISSVLLTPPSDEDAFTNGHLCLGTSTQNRIDDSTEYPYAEELSNNAIYDNHIENGFLDSSIGRECRPLFENCEKNQPQKDLLHDSGITDQSVAPSQVTDSSNHSSPQHSSNSSKFFSNYTTDVSGNLSVDDECDSSSPLHRVKVPDKYFRQSLLHRLHEYAIVNGSSTSTSLNSTPEVSPYHRARTVSLDQDEAVSANGSLDQELFSSGAQLGETTTECFETLEHEVYDIADEFQDICAKLDELKRLAARNSGSEDVECDSEYTPSDPLARRACDLVERARDKIIRSRSMSLSDDSGSSRNGSFRETDGVELSWDSEHMTEGQSQNKQSNFKEKLSVYAKALESQEEESEDKYTTASENSVKVPEVLVQEKCNNSDRVSSKESDQASKLADWSMSIDEIMSESESVSLTTCLRCGKIRIRAQDLDLSDFDVDICRCRDKRSDDTDQDVRDTELDSGPEDRGNSDLNKCPPTATGPLAVGQSCDVIEYAEKEWRGQTEKAMCIKKAYHEVPKLLKCRHLCQIRGDNYCAIRGTVYQCLANKIDIVKNWKSANSVIENLQKCFRDDNSGLKVWNFANRLPFNSTDSLSLMARCVHTLFSKVEEARALSSYKHRLEWAAQVLNTDSDCDLQLMEAVKLLMYLTALRLYHRNVAGEDVPVFVWLMFARDTSESMVMFVRNHLNCVGDSAGLEQVEMCLLGYALGIKIQVLRLSQFGKEDFLTSFPEESEADWPIISLLAEDDRHYNVPVLISE